MSRVSAATGSYRPAASRGGQHDLAFFRSPGGVAKRLQDVLAFQVGVVGKDFIDAVPRADLPHDHADRDAHPTDARLDHTTTAAQLRYFLTTVEVGLGPMAGAPVIAESRLASAGATLAR